MVDAWAALNTLRIGEPPIAFAAGVPVEDVIRAIAARAELRIVVRSVAEAFDIVRGLFGWEVYVDPRGQFVWIGVASRAPGAA